MGGAVGGQYRVTVVQNHCRTEGGQGRGEGGGGEEWGGGGGGGRALATQSPMAITF